MMRISILLPLAAALFFAGPAQADQTDPKLDQLFGQLHSVETVEADGVQQEIWQVWHQSGSETVDLLMLDASEAIQRGLHEQAETQYDAVVDLAPSFAEGWNRRATLRFMRGNYNGSIEDIVRVLELEPRHFGALAGLGMIYDRLNQPEAALKSFEQALLINPHLADVRTRVEKLQDELKDRDI